MRRVSRRQALATLGASAWLAGCATMAADDAHPPIVFVHGNGDSGAIWMTTLWRFESNGWPRDRLHTFDLPWPIARDAEGQGQPGRTSVADYSRMLAKEVERVREATGARKVVLFGSSRGGYAIRNYIDNGGAGAVSHAILAGTPNHGVWADPRFLPGSEFNGTGPFLTRMNRPRGPRALEVTPGVAWLTIRSDHNDKYAQPDGRWIGAPGVPTGVTHDSPALKGATNLVLPGLDHRETAFHPQAFAAAYRFITGAPPATTAIVPEGRVRLDGKVLGLGLDNGPGSGSFINNLPLDGAVVAVFATDAASGARLGKPVHRKTVDADGRWGPFDADAGAHYEFVVAARGFSTTHLYRSPFPRSSDIVHLQARRLEPAELGAGSVVVFSRLRGYFDVQRDRMRFDGHSPPPGVPAGVAGVSESTLLLAPAPPRTVVGEFNDERIAARSWSAADNRVVRLELQG